MEEVNHIDHYNAARPGTHPTAVTHSRPTKIRTTTNAPPPNPQDWILLDWIVFTGPVWSQSDRPSASDIFKEGPASLYL